MATAIVITLTGCGSDSTGTASSPTPAPASATVQPHNAQDVTFAQMMIPHHQQAVEMATLAAGRARAAEVKQLAIQIEQAQDPEIKMMQGWLAGWGESTAVPGDPHGGHDSGMMTTQQMQQLSVASGAAFDTMFLEMMTAHHQGAIAMAQIELAEGQYPPAKQLARSIVDSQQAEIDQMKQLLASGS